MRDMGWLLMSPLSQTVDVCHGMQDVRTVVKLGSFENLLDVYQGGGVYK